MSTIRNLLKESVVNPRTDSSIQIIAETGNRGYYEARAFEMVRAASEALEDDKDEASYHENMKMAISLLALARATVPVTVPA